MLRETPWKAPETLDENRAESRMGPHAVSLIDIQQNSIQNAASLHLSKARIPTSTEADRRGQRTWGGQIVEVNIYIRGAKQIREQPHKRAMASSSTAHGAGQVVSASVDIIVRNASILYK